MEGFSLHAAVRCGAEDGQALEQLCRTITRPALANERVQTNAAGQVVLQLKTPWHDGTTHQGTPPLEFMQRLAARVPRPRLHLIRFHGVLAPRSTNSAKLRPVVVPRRPAPHMSMLFVMPVTNGAGVRLHMRAARAGGAQLFTGRADTKYCGRFPSSLFRRPLP